MTSVKTQFITLFGKQYKVRCPAGQETTLKRTEDLLNQQLLETKKNSGLTNREDIIMMTALNLCKAAIEKDIAVQTASDSVATTNHHNASRPQQRVGLSENAIAQAANKASKILSQKPER